MHSSEHFPTSNGPGPHTVLGAGGVIARALSQELLAQGQRVRQVGRHPQAVLPGSMAEERVAADLLDGAATAKAVAGSAVAYLVAGMPYDTATWRAQWPVVMRNTIEACVRHGVPLVFLDNVYAYGRVEGRMTEDTPFNPCSRKGEVRAAIATELLTAMHRGEIRALIARSADFYGPGATNSLMASTLFARLRAGKAPQWIGNPKAVHTFTYTPDAGRAMARLAQTPSAFGQTWHLPTAETLEGQAVTGERLVRAACELAGRPDRFVTAPRWLLRAMGWFIPVLRENDEMMYQFEYDYRFDSRKIAQALDLQPTAYRDGLAAALASA